MFLKASAIADVWYVNPDSVHVVFATVRIQIVYHEYHRDPFVSSNPPTPTGSFISVGADQCFYQTFAVLPGQVLEVSDFINPPSGTPDTTFVDGRLGEFAGHIATLYDMQYDSNSGYWSEDDNPPLYYSDIQYDEYLHGILKVVASGGKGKFLSNDSYESANGVLTIKQGESISIETKTWNYMGPSDFQLMQVGIVQSVGDSNTSFEIDPLSCPSDYGSSYTAILNYEYLPQQPGIYYFNVVAGGVMGVDCNMFSLWVIVEP